MSADSDRNIENLIPGNMQNSQDRVVPMAIKVSLSAVPDSTSETAAGMLAEAVVSESDIVFEPELFNESPVAQDDGDAAQTRKRSWPFLIVDFVCVAVRRSFGFASLVFLLAVAASLPVIQVLTLGYLLEAKGRIGRSGKLRDGLFGFDKAARIGSIALGTWLLLWPIRIASGFWYEAQLIDPGSNQSVLLRAVQIVLAVLLGVNILAAWFCGGKLRYFFWPLVAPFSFGIWAVKKIASSSFLRPVLDALFGWISANFVNDLCAAKPITDWFLPAILCKSLFGGTLYQNARDGVWEFVMGLRLPYYFWLGLRGLVGTVLWLFGPTVFLITATMFEDGAAVICGLIGVFLSTIVYVFVPFLQTHFAAQRRFMCFFEISEVLDGFRKTPFHHWLALFLMFLFALPLFLLKIERIPGDLVWLLSVVFILFTLPAHWMVGWAYGRARKKDSKGWLLFSIPTFLMTFPVTFAFTFIFFFTRYVSWNGAWSLFEHHAFLLPAPLWLFG